MRGSTLRKGTLDTPLLCSFFPDTNNPAPINANVTVVGSLDIWGETPNVELCLMPFGKGHLWFGRIVKPKGPPTKAKGLRREREKGNLEPRPTKGLEEIAMTALS